MVAYFSCAKIHATPTSTKFGFAEQGLFLLAVDFLWVGALFLCRHLEACDQKEAGEQYVEFHVLKLFSFSGDTQGWVYPDCWSKKIWVGVWQEFFNSFSEGI